MSETGLTWQGKSLTEAWCRMNLNLVLSSASNQGNSRSLFCFRTNKVPEQSKTSNATPMLVTSDFRQVKPKGSLFKGITVQQHSTCGSLRAVPKIGWNAAELVLIGAVLSAQALVRENLAPKHTRLCSSQFIFSSYHSPTPLDFA